MQTSERGEATQALRSNQVLNSGHNLAQVCGGAVVLFSNQKEKKK